MEYFYVHLRLYVCLALDMLFALNMCYSLWICRRKEKAGAKKKGTFCDGNTILEKYSADERGFRFLPTCSLWGEHAFVIRTMIDTCKNTSIVWKYTRAFTNIEFHVSDIFLFSFALARPSIFRRSNITTFVFRTGVSTQLLSHQMTSCGMDAQAVWTAMCLRHGCAK